ncbi:hypothetical protein Leryth_021931 [Lithospermum erythrorhizon]|nr:hypothetical protein Leryth_021931 [Lithospermum erythrorhizon]
MVPRQSGTIDNVYNSCKQTFKEFLMCRRRRLPIRVLQCKVIGPAADKDRIPGIDIALNDGNKWMFAGHEVHIMDTPGHTRDSLVSTKSDIDLGWKGNGDEKLALGMRGSNEVSYPTTNMQEDCDNPLLPSFYTKYEIEPIVICNVSSQSNSKFALSIEPGNQDLLSYAAHVSHLRNKGFPTIPTTLKTEKSCNPFLRTSSLEIRKSLNIPAAADEAKALGIIWQAKVDF